MYRPIEILPNMPLLGDGFPQSIIGDNSDNGISMFVGTHTN